LLLLLGAEGIAVGLSPRVLPHNFNELLRAQIAILEKKPFEILPDFQQGGLMDVSEYDRGSGRVRVRSKIEIDKDNVLVIRTVPPGTTTDSVIASIETAARKRKLAIRSIDDFTAETVEIRVVLKPEQKAERAVQALHAFTLCEVALPSRIVVIHKNRPVEMNAEKALRHATTELIKTLRRELENERSNLLDAVHRLTLVQIFVEQRIYKRIEECTSLPEVQQAVFEGVNRYREWLRRDVTGKDVQTLLDVKIKRISRYDMDKNRKEIADLLEAVEKAEANLQNLSAHAIRYLRGLLRKYGSAYPRQTEITRFKNVAVRDLTANELTLRYDRKKGYLGHAVSGDELFQCSSLDKILVVRADGKYRVTNPPDKLFVDCEMPYCGIADRDRIFVLVYRDEDGMSYLKRFAFGGAILNREYSCAPPRSHVMFIAEDDPKIVYVKYQQLKGVHIDPQSFDLSKVKIRGVKTRGTLMTPKPIASIHGKKPRGWSDKKSGLPGSLLNC
jgi:topoisomerase-4 subunit A